MKTATITKPALINSLIINSIAVVLIYFTPALSHLLNFPLYLIEPMRLMLILAMVHSNKQNAFLLALTLPLFSYAISAHPVFYKMLLISAELTLNVWLYYMLVKAFKNNFTALLSSILISKVAYYILKAVLIYALILEPGLFSTPIWIQLVTSLVFSGYAFFIMRRRGLTGFSD